MDKIFIKDLKALGIIGVFPHERLKPQKILINVTIFTDTQRAAQTDDIVDCIDYDSLAKKIKSHAERAERFTVEALANDLATICLQVPGVERAVVRVEKPGAVPPARSVGVEVERTRE